MTQGLILFCNDQSEMIVERNLYGSITLARADMGTHL
jgi:hypothetical protein